MKNIFFLLLLISTAVNGQLDRTQVSGTIAAKSDDSLGGITIFNLSSLEGTVTNERGEFFIDLKDGDKLSFSAVQFTNFELLIGQETIKSKTLKITLRDGVNELDEVRITNGSFMIPVKRTVQVDAKLDKVSNFYRTTAAVDRIENTFSDRIRQPEEYAIRNEAFNQSQPRFNMINVVGILAALVVGTTLNAINVDSGATAIENREEFQVAVLKNKFSTDYLVDFLKIEETDLYDFMYFAKDRGLNNSFFTPEKELDLLQFLSESAALYKERKKN